MKQLLEENSPLRGELEHVLSEMKAWVNATVALVGTSVYLEPVAWNFQGLYSTDGEREKSQKGRIRFLLAWNRAYVPEDGAVEGIVYWPKEEDIAAGRWDSDGRMKIGDKTRFWDNGADSEEDQNLLFTLVQDRGRRPLLIDANHENQGSGIEVQYLPFASIKYLVSFEFYKEKWHHVTNFRNLRVADQIKDGRRDFATIYREWGYGGATTGTIRIAGKNDKSAWIQVASKLPQPPKLLPRLIGERVDQLRPEVWLPDAAELRNLK